MTDDNDVKALLAEIGQQPPRCGFEVGHGWFPVVADALREMTKVSQSWQLEQVKQKFCQLRIYWCFTDRRDDTNAVQNAQRAALSAIIERAATKCDAMCEACGAEVPSGWQTGRKLCIACRKAPR